MTEAIEGDVKDGNDIIMTDAQDFDDSDVINDAKKKKRVKARAKTHGAASSRIKFKKSTSWKFIPKSSLKEYVLIVPKKLNEKPISEGVPNNLLLEFNEAERIEELMIQRTSTCYVERYNLIMLISAQFDHLSRSG